MSSQFCGDYAYEYLHRILLIGDSDVGKSNILHRLKEDKFNEDHWPTVGVDFGIKTIQVNDSWVKFQIWDTVET